MYDFIFGAGNGLEKILDNYCEYWSESGRNYDDNCDVCSTLDRFARDKGDHLFNLIFSNLPATATTIVHAAAILIQISDGKPEDIHPISVEYHLFSNCCFTTITDSSAGPETKTSSGILNTPATYTKTRNEFVRTGVSNVIDIGHLMNYMPRSCPGECGRFKTLAVQFTRKLLDEKSEGVLYLNCDDDDDEEGAEETEENGNESVLTGSGKEMDTIKRRFFGAIKTVNEVVFKYLDIQPGEEDGVNYLSNFHECKLCSLLPVLTGLNDWETEYNDTFARLVNTTVTTVVRCMKTKLPGMTEKNIIYHKSNPTCLLNERRNVYMMETFSNSESLSSPLNVKNFTSNFLKERNRLICADAVYAVWLHKLKVNGHGSTEKIARYISKVFREHGVSF